VPAQAVAQSASAAMSAVRVLIGSERYPILLFSLRADV
jgi:hypothetical protein